MDSYNIHRRMLATDSKDACKFLLTPYLNCNIQHMPLGREKDRKRTVRNSCSGKRAGSGLANALDPEAKGSEPLSVDDIAAVKYQTRPAHDRCNA